MQQGAPLGKNERPRVFISSTLEDLEQFRAKVVEVVLRLGWEPIDCRYWAAGGNPPLNACLRRVDSADVVVALVAQRHGWTPPDQLEGRQYSITRLECERAAGANRIEVIPFLLSDSTPWDAKLAEAHRITLADPGKMEAVALEVARNVSSLADFKNWLDQISTRKRFSNNPDELAMEVLHALKEWDERRQPKEDASRHGATYSADSRSNSEQPRVWGGLHVDAMHELPPLTLSFTGRDAKVQEITDLLRPQERDLRAVVITAAIEGLGGVGKTALAVAAAHALKQSYPDSQLFFDLRAHSRNPVTGVAARNAWLQRLAPDAKLPEDEHLLAAMYRTHLCGKDGRGLRALVVVDDPKSEEDIEVLSPPAGCGLLVTSRRALAGCSAVTLEALTLDQATSLLKAVCPRLRSDENVERLAILCARWPIALRAAGAYLHRMKSKPVGEYIAALESDRIKLLAQSAGQDARLDVEAVMGYSLSALEPAQSAALRSLCSAMPGDFGREAGIAVADCDARVLDELTDTNLLSFRSDEHRFATHDLVRELTLKQVEAGFAARAKVRHAEHFSELVRLADECHVREGSDAAARDLLHLFDRERQNIEAAMVFMQAGRSSDPNLGRVLDAANHVKELRLRTLAANLDLAKRRRAALKAGVGTMAVAACVGVLGYELLKPNRTRGDTVLLFGASLLLVVLAAAVLLARNRFTPTRVLILGTGAEARQVDNVLSQARYPRVEVVGFCVAQTTDSLAQVDESRILGRADELQGIAARMGVTEVVIAVKDLRGPALPNDQLTKCALDGIRITDFLTLWERTRKEVPLIALKASDLIYDATISSGSGEVAVRRGFDLAFSVLILLLTLPWLILAALAIKLESAGPILYRQERVGLRGKRFMLVKLRTMRTDAENDGVARWATASDTRVTRVGALLRRTRIDELPQMFNVLRGEMSWIGPRAERPYFAAELQRQIPFYELRHAVKPGLTGWAQVRYSYGATVEDALAKHQYDLYYLKNRSLLLDLRILLETVLTVMFRLR